MENRPTYQFDIIRGLMCIMIFNRHFLNLFDNLSFMPNALLEFFSDSQLGLFYFFTLSGLVITMSFKRKEQSVSKFALKRLLYFSLFSCNNKLFNLLRIVTFILRVLTNFILFVIIIIEREVR